MQEARSADPADWNEQTSGPPQQSEKMIEVILIAGQQLDVQMECKSSLILRNERTMSFRLRRRHPFAEKVP